MPTNISSPMTYMQLNTYLQTIIVDQAPSTDYTVILPAVIQDAEQRIYRDMDFISTRTIDSTGALTAGNRNFTLPTDTVVFLVVQGVSVLPVGSTFGTTGKQTVLDPVSLDDIDWTWPDPTVQKLPGKWTMLNDTTIVVGATPDQNYPVVITGTFRPASMSAANQTSYIGNIYPDLLVKACMIFLAGYQRDFGQQSDNPQLAVSWKTEYADALKSAMSEEQRRKGQGQGWEHFSPTPEATPPRT